MSYLLEVVFSSLKKHKCKPSLLCIESANLCKFDLQSRKLRLFPDISSMTFLLWFIHRLCGVFEERRNLISFNEDKRSAVKVAFHLFEEPRTNLEPILFCTYLQRWSKSPQVLHDEALRKAASFVQEAHAPKATTGWHSQHRIEKPFETVGVVFPNECAVETEHNLELDHKRGHEGD